MLVNRDAAASASPETPADHEPWKGIWDQLFFSLNAYACALRETFLGPCLQCSRQLFLKLLSARYFSVQTEVPLKSKSTLPELGIKVLLDLLGETPCYSPKIVVSLVQIAVCVSLNKSAFS